MNLEVVWHLENIPQSSPEARSSITPVHRIAPDGSFGSLRILLLFAAKAVKSLPLNARLIGLSAVKRVFLMKERFLLLRCTR